MTRDLSALKEKLEKSPRLVLIISALVIWIGILIAFQTYGYEETWRLWQIPTLRPAFVDFRIIPGSAETLRMGLDPRVENPGDPLGRLFNLPEAWTLLFHAGISQSDTIWISTLSIIIFFICAVWFPGKLNVEGVIAMLLVLFSPAAMLLYERGNVDLFMIMLIIFALLAMNLSMGFSLFFVLIAATLKFYPVLGLGMFLRESKRKFQLIFWSVSLLFAIYVAVSFDSFLAIWAATERGTAISYGVNVLAANMEPGLEHYLSPLVGKDLLLRTLSIVPYAYALILLVLVLRLCIHNDFNLPTSDQKNLNAFRAGAAIFMGTFLLGNNWDYRLIFLVLTVPQIVMWTKSAGDKKRGIPILALAGILLSCWYMFFAQYATSSQVTVAKKLLYIFDEMINWTTFLSLAALFFASSPDWLKGLTTRVVGLKKSFIRP